MIDIQVEGTTKADLERALSKFRKSVKKAGVLESVRSRQEFVKPSKAKRNKRNKAASQRRTDERLAQKREAKRWT